MDFLVLLRSGGRLCGWLEKALWEYCISKDYFEESKSLSLSLLHFDFALCTCLCLSFSYLIFKNHYGVKAVSVQLLAHGCLILL